MSLYLRGLNVTLQQDTDGHFHDSLNTSLLIAVHLAHADIVLAIAGGC